MLVVKARDCPCLSPQRSPLYSRARPRVSPRPWLKELKTRQLEGPSTTRSLDSSVLFHGGIVISRSDFDASEDRERRGAALRARLPDIKLAFEAEQRVTVGWSGINATRCERCERQVDTTFRENCSHLVGRHPCVSNRKDWIKEHVTFCEREIDMDCVCLLLLTLHIYALGACLARDAEIMLASAPAEGAHLGGIGGDGSSLFVRGVVRVEGEREAGRRRGCQRALG
jgi:hypothetical protein